MRPLNATEAQALPDTEDALNPFWSPDSRSLSFGARAAEGKLGGDKKRISTGGGSQPRFRRDGRELFYVAADGQMMAVEINGATFETPTALFKTRLLTGLIQPGIEYDVTADGERFLIGTQVGEATPVSVILNWPAELTQ